MGYKFFLLFSHKLTPAQIEDATQNWGISQIVYLPPQLQKLWSNVPPELDLKEVEIQILKPIKRFLLENGKEGDRVLIQGDFGAVCRMVEFAKRRELVPLYATTRREVEERKEGDKIVKISHFKHIRFRRF
jgi:hypothetical protein